MSVVEAPESAAGPSPVTLKRLGLATDSVAKRERWGSSTEFVLTLVGFAVGLGNVWRFPYLCFTNGGAAFMIPYFIITLLLGIPMFALETGVGQRFQRGTAALWPKISLWSSGIGFASALSAFLISLYYNALIAYSCYYFFSSLRLELPWAGESPLEDAEKFFFNDVLQRSEGVNEIGGLNWRLLIAFGLAWVLIWGVISKGVKSAGKVVYFTATFPYVILIVLLVRAVTLPGSWNGLKFFLIPEWSRVADPWVWVAAGQQVFFSLSVGNGTYVTFGSFNSPNYNFFRWTWAVPAINAFTSILAGFAVFGVLGFLSETSGVAVPELPLSGVRLAFIAYPTALTLLPWAPVWAAAFFFMLICLGVDSQFALTETALNTLVEGGVTTGKKWVDALLICSFSAAVGLVFMTSAGMYFVDMVDFFVNAYGIFIVVAAELVAILAAYGISRLEGDFRSLIGRGPDLFLRLAWRFVTPMLAVGLIPVALWQLSTTDFSSIFCADASADSRCVKEAGVWASAVGQALSCLVPLPLVLVPLISLVFKERGGEKKGIGKRRGSDDAAQSSACSGADESDAAAEGGEEEDDLEANCGGASSEASQINCTKAWGEDSRLQDTAEAVAEDKMKTKKEMAVKPFNGSFPLERSVTIFAVSAVAAVSFLNAGDGEGAALATAAPPRSTDDVQAIKKKEADVSESEINWPSDDASVFAPGEENHSPKTMEEFSVKRRAPWNPMTV
uniref:Transporter n=1 Tax=Chromera velia CCMP2878 TaxID=1169474 RepID=A0A0G4F1F6_9ALVE|mmetsp:Transcript_1748/g.3633  ORF Transcript_1748/g.3633 Transcript_1748/m.3633 type:complete len:730 (-) Transcript_1748:441-2630(-)|eukprot:Cvel_14713.t1-p1 / transcript=Cvel_14713.t1 / gene=Cvel_14713 / organism=Chromera_velia_CCMP2878 / gene_product=Sodium-dependent proline transporter, putative / transcript_product=Sodium-dependent proline transporter, putative / location=Cvel_scaffold1057:26075-32533(-) / protein_length=729 / sequence_SO=supercontig / SO=protein_coding / is_pseudo=false